MIDRKLHNILEPDGCWHNVYGDVSGHTWCRRCNRELTLPVNNPTYDNPAVIAEKMRERGLWEEFVIMSRKIMWSIADRYNSLNKYNWNTMIHDDDIACCLADILTTPALLAQAIISWHELTHAWKDGKYERRN